MTNSTPDADRSYMYDVLFHAAGTALARVSAGTASTDELSAVLACVVAGLRYARANVHETQRMNIVRRVKWLLTVSSDYSFADEALERRGVGLSSPTTLDVASTLATDEPRRPDSD